MVMVTQRNYTAEAVAACKSVLVELVQLLGEFRDHMVIVGGWVPLLLVAETTSTHPGTLDIDLALDFAKIPDDSYRTMLRHLTSRGYRQDEDQPFRFFRTVGLPGGRQIEVEIDLLAGEYGGTGPKHRTQRFQDVRARKARGCDLVFDNFVEVAVEGELPGGGRNRVTLRVAALVPWLVMKGMALHDRIKEKDAFDIYYIVRNHPGGTEPLAEQFRPYLENPLILEGLRKIRAKFGSVEDVGPKWVADFLGMISPEERAVTIRDAYESMSALLDALGIDAWK